MSRTAAPPWYRDFYKVAVSAIGSISLGAAVTVGIYIRTIQGHDEDIKALKASQSWHELDKRLSIVEDRMSRAKDQAAAPLIAGPSLRPAAGKQR